MTAQKQKNYQYAPFPTASSIAGPYYQNPTIHPLLQSVYPDEMAHYYEPSGSTMFITKKCLYNFDPLKPHFYIVKLGFTGVYIIFLISA